MQVSIKAVAALTGLLSFSAGVYGDSDVATTNESRRLVPSLFDASGKYPYTGNPDCKDLGFDFGWKLDKNCPNGDDWNKEIEIRGGSQLSPFGETDSNSCSVGKDIGAVKMACSDLDGNDYRKATITQVDSWKPYVIMKGGNGGTVYNTLVQGSPITLDVGSKSAISHIEFCFMCDGAPTTTAGSTTAATTTKAATTTAATTTAATTTAATTTAQTTTAATTTAATTTAQTTTAATTTAATTTAQTTTTTPQGSSYGDPHVMTWDGSTFDFHGACDLVLVNNPEFANGLGLDIHIRTKIQTWWSYIDTAVLRIGGDTLEVQGGQNTATFWINGERQELPEQDGEVEATIGGSKIKYANISMKTKIFQLHPARGVSISLQTFNDFVRVNVKADEANGNMIGAVGLMGTYPSGKMVDRDGDLVKDAVEFGKEWQVRSTEVKLFHSAEGVQHPEECRMPDPTVDKSRRLGESMITEEDASRACARVNEEERDNCIFDVLATNDKDMAGSY